MVDMTLSYQVTREELGLGNLELQDPANGYEVVRFGPGAMAWNRQTVKSPFIHGEVLVGATMGLETAPLTVRVRASTAAALDSRLAVLLAAFSQFAYFAGADINGQPYIWACQPADWSVGENGEFNKFHVMAKIAEVSLSIPRDPTPTAGVI
jgi:hypothetical protein